jgi:hypothetical protein
MSCSSVETDCFFNEEDSNPSLVTISSALTDSDPDGEVVQEEATPELDKQWNMRYEKLVDFKQKNGHCLVPRLYMQDKPLGEWVSKQRTVHNNNKMRLDRKGILDEVGFAWKGDPAHNFNVYVQLWHQQYEHLVEFKRKNGHCMVPFKYEQNKSLGRWVAKQRMYYRNNKMRLERKRLLDEIGLASKDDSLASRSSTTTDVRGGLVIGSFHALGRACFSLSFFFCLFV